MNYAPELELLAAQCSAVHLPPVPGWEVDRWTLSDTAKGLLVSAYRVQIMPVREEVDATLRKRGIDVDKLFFDPTDSRDVTTRATLTELAAGASAIAIDGLPRERMVLPCIPTGSRKQNAPGIDVLVAEIDDTGDDDLLAPHEMIHIYSVKHTIKDVGDLRRKLLDSLSPTQLTMPYLASQLRVLTKRLQERGFEQADRAFLCLDVDDVLDSPHIRVVAVAAADTVHEQALANEVAQLSVGHPDPRRFRMMIIRDLPRFHTLVAS